MDERNIFVSTEKGCGRWDPTKVEGIVQTQCRGEEDNEGCRHAEEGSCCTKDEEVGAEKGSTEEEECPEEEGRS